MDPWQVPLPDTSMWTARAIAFRDDLETCANSKFKLLGVLRRERWGQEERTGVGVGGEAVRLSPKYWAKLNEMIVRAVLNSTVLYESYMPVVWGSRLCYSVRTRLADVMCICAFMFRTDVFVHVNFADTIK